MARAKASTGRQWRIPPGFERAFRELQSIPNVGKAMAEDLVRLRVRSVRALARRSPMRLYEGISRLDGVRHDPCVLDTFMAAVEYARTGVSKPWWAYTARRKAMLEVPGVVRRSGASSSRDEGITRRARAEPPRSGGPPKRPKRRSLAVAMRRADVPPGKTGAR